MISTVEETRVPAIAVGSREFTSVPGLWAGMARQLPVLPLAILVPFILIALLADLIAPYDPAARTRYSGPIFRAAIC